MVLAIQIPNVLNAARQFVLSAAGVVLAVLFCSVGVARQQDVGGEFSQSRELQTQTQTLFQFSSVDLQLLESMSPAELHTAIVAELNRANAGWSIEQIENDPRANKLLQAKKFLEQTLQLLQLAEQHAQRTNSLPNSVAPVSHVEPLEKWQNQLDIARQKWPLIGERSRWLTEQISKKAQDVRTLKEFIQDDESLMKFVSAMCQSRMLLAENLALTEEARNVANDLRELPAKIRETQQLVALATPAIGQSTNAGTTEIATAAAATAKSKSPTFDSDRSLLIDTHLHTDEQALDLPDESDIETRCRALEREISILQRQTKSLREKEANLKEKVDVLGLTEANEIVLLEALRALPDEQKNRIQNFGIEQEVRALSMQIIHTENHLESAISRIQNDPKTESIPEDQWPQEIKALQSSLLLQRKLNQLQLTVSTERDNLMHASRTMRAFLTSQLLWVQNSDAIGWSDIQNGSEGLFRLAQPNIWYELFVGLGHRVVLRPVELAVFIFGLTALTFAKRRLSSDRSRKSYSPGANR